MKTKLTFLLSLTFLFLFSGSVFADDFQDAVDAYKRKDYKTAYKLFLPLAEQGDADAQYSLGLMYANGEGVPQDYKEAVKWFRLSAEQGIAEGQNNLGLMYSKGQGVPQDYKEAVKWYRLSAEQGDAQAQYNLGVMYGDGKGVLQNFIQAHRWYNIAGANGEDLGRKNRDIVEKKMSPAQIAEAQKLAREWMEEHGKE